MNDLSPSLPGGALLFVESVTQTNGCKSWSYNDLVAQAAVPDSYSNKLSIPAFLPCQAADKTKQAVELANAQTALVLDLDDNPLTEQQLKSKLAEFGAAYLYYSTHSSTLEKPRWRIVWPLAKAVSIELWQRSQRYLISLFSADECCSRIQQLSFMPAVPPHGHYVYGHRDDMPALELDSDSWQQRLSEFELAEQQAQDAFDKAPKPKREMTDANQLLFDHLKQRYPLPSLLLECGFKRVGNKWLPPESRSKIAGVQLFDGDKAGLCHNNSCPLFADGGRFDAIDVLLHYRYGGDWALLFKAEGDALIIDGVSWNQHQQKQSSKMQNLPELMGKNQLAQLATSVAKQAQFPLNTTTLVALGIASSWTAAAYCISYPDGERLAGGLYIAVEQPPASAKSRVLNAFANPIQEQVGQLNQRWQAASDEDPELPQRKLAMFMSNATPEAIEQSMLAPNNGFFSLASAERSLINILLGCGIKDRPNDNDLTLKGFNGEYHCSARISRSGYSGLIHGAVTVVAQSNTINTILGQSNGQGIAERFLLFSEPTLVGTRNFRSVGLNQPRCQFKDRYQLAAEAIATTISNLVDSNLSNLIALKICQQGWEQINDYRQKIEPYLGDGKKFSHNILRGAFGKADMQIMKVAATLHVFEATMHGGKPSNTIDLNWVQVAIKLVDALLVNLYQILEAKGEIGRDAECDAVMAIFDKDVIKSEREIIKSRVKVRPFSGLTGNKSTAIRLALARCVEAGWLVLEQGSQKSTNKYRLA